MNAILSALINKKKIILENDVRLLAKCFFKAIKERHINPEIFK